MRRSALPADRSGPKGRLLVVARTYAGHRYPDWSGVFARFADRMSAVVVRATVRVTQQGIGGEDLT